MENPKENSLGLLVHLNIEFEDRGKNIEEILSVYFENQMMADLDQLAWNLCDCNSEIQKQEIGKMELKDLTIKQDNFQNFIVSVDLKLSGQNQSLIDQILKEYLDALPDYIRYTVLEIESRFGSRLGFTGNPQDYEYHFV